MSDRGLGDRLRPWLVAITAVYGLTVAVWLAAIDWSGEPDGSTRTTISALSR